MDGNYRDREPLVSVIIPTYNRRDLIGEALDSVLSQTYRNYEIIIVDDGSADGTGDFVEAHYKGFAESGVIRYFYSDHAGISESRNRGIENASGDLLAFIDSDDIWEKDKLSLQVNYLKAHPDCSIVGTLYKNFFRGSADQLSEESRKVLNEEKHKYYFASFCLRKAVFKTCGMMDTSLKTGEDTEWIIRAKCFGYDICVIELELYHRRVHNLNISCNDAFGTEEIFRKNMLRACHNHIIRKSKHECEA